MKLIDVIIETPKGSSLKFTYNKKNNAFNESKILPLGMCFPFDFGFIPGTKGADGDPLDVIVISEHPSFTGCRMKVRIIGCIKGIQKEKNKKPVRNDRYLAVPENAILFSHVTSFEQFPAVVTEQLVDFFIQYNKLSGKKFNSPGICNPEKAYTRLKEAGI